MTPPITRIDTKPKLFLFPFLSVSDRRAGGRAYLKVSDYQRVDQIIGEQRLILIWHLNSSHF